MEPLHPRHWLFWLFWLFWIGVIGAALALALCAKASFAATVRYVDNDSACPGDGSDASPFCTIQQAVGVAECGDVLRLRQGDTPYTEQVSVTQPSCPLERPVHLEPERTQEIVWTPKRSPRNDLYALRLQDVDGWVVRGLHLVGTVDQPRYAVIVQASTRSVSHVHLLGNTITDWNMHTRGANVAPILVQGSIKDGHTVIATRLVANRIVRFRGRGLTVRHSRQGYYAYNDIGYGVCGPATPGAQVYLKLEAVHTDTGDPASLAQSHGDVWEYNALHDLQTPQECMAQTGQSERMTVHAFWCDVGASHGIFRFNRVWHIAKGAVGNVRVARWEARCHGWVVHDNHLWDNGGASLWVNGYNFDTIFERNRIERPAGACVQLGGEEPRRVVLRENICRDPGGRPLVLYGDFTQDQLTQEGNSWQQPAP